ncbi:cation-transporting P-type ATPase [Amycolatopsis acidiphila]|uniref:Cation-transporting P-type ATPase n=1 Tax=Amycolatopsis acidiphila TaxID=715473 RepID=A0A558AJ42_9PSEU|nr:cation-transporting P-type ATPase [Amycolatopsis acidiphila]TVT24288.1 cation-transporting P-type ATPase [Amycolatopsis acidiphila]UIJ62579.1 cation-transporting P-type ATPase [Amycolatopsis acidiphila]
MHRPGTENAVRALRQRLLELDGVRSVEVNGHWGHAVVGRDPDVVGQEEILAAVADVEREWELREQAPASVRHPANPGPGIRELAAAGLSLAGTGYAFAGRILPVPPLPPVWPALLSLVDSSPRLRTVVEDRLGRPATDALFALGSATSQALARSPVGLLTDTGYRLLLHREAGARQQAWREWEREAAARPGTHEAEAVDYPPRPAPRPGGPIEKLADGSTALGLAGFGTILATTRNPDRATGVLVAAVPRAAKLGREAFAARLDTGFSGTGSLVLESDVLRRLDRVDTVVLDSASLLTGRSIVDSVLPLGEVDEAGLSQRVHDLVDLRDPGTRRERHGWALTTVGGELSLEVRQRADQLAEPDGTVLVLLHGSVPAALVRLLPEADPMAEALVEAAGSAGSVLLAGRPALRNRLPVDGMVAGGAALADEIRRLQEDGHVVALVSGHERAALAAADAGIGLPCKAGAVPWGADVVCPDAGQVCLLLSATAIARRTSVDVTRLSIAGSVVGALLGGFGPAAGASARTSFPVHLAAALALVVGTWRGMTVGAQPVPLPADRTPWHEMSPPAVLELLSSSPEGLAEAESARRQGRTGAGEEPAETGLARASVDELANPLTPALAAGAGISASVGSISDALLIAGVLGLNALIGGAQRVGAGRELRRLIDTSSARVRLRREGRVRDARAVDLTPGDVIELRAGDAVPADGRLIEAGGLEVDESSLTGESQLVTKTVAATTAADVADRHSMVYQGTVIAAGRALAVVVAAGDLTEAGRSAHAGGDAPKTGVEARLSALSSRTLPLAFGAGGVLMALALLRGRGISQSLGQAVSLAVAAVPEGLPFVATVAELASARRLSHQGVLVRSPSTIEALGRVDVLCFDKTGTLTEGRIALRRVSDGVTDAELHDLADPLRAVLASAVRASPWQEGDGGVPHPTDRAVLDGARELGVTPQEGVGELEWVAEIAFEPARGYHATLARHGDGLLLSVKGAPEVLLARCTSWRDGMFGPSARRQVEAEVERLARQGFRVLGVAERAASGRADLDDERIRRLEFRGLVALADPVRPTAAGAVTQLREAGVDVLMVTGDHPSTAAAIAAELDMIDGRGVLTGAELDALEDMQLAEVLPRIAVFARVSPAQKARLVRQLRKAGRVAAMTGDGANDAPAIRLAHVGIALGSRATAAAREAADLVVTDDRIETITGALIEGRAMWSSVRDAVGILLGGNLGEIVFTLLSGVFSDADVLNARQLLLVNLLTDVLPAMAVAVRPPADATPDRLLAEGPEASLGGVLVHDVYRRAVITAASAGAGWLFARPVGTPRQAATTALVALVGGQLAQTIAVRGRTPLVVGAGLASLVVLALVVQTPGLSQFFGCRPLLPHQWAIAGGAATAAAAAELLWHAR